MRFSHGLSLLLILLALSAADTADRDLEGNALLCANLNSLASRRDLFRGFLAAS